jgi:hypothetical protein
LEVAPDSYFWLEGYVIINMRASIFRTPLRLNEEGCA